ncbi:hypothetical protein NHX12_025970, partial [Muraenolepis orangiensis]
MVYISPGLSHTVINPDKALLPLCVSPGVHRVTVKGLMLCISSRPRRAQIQPTSSPERCRQLRVALIASGCFDVRDGDCFAREGVSAGPRVIGDGGIYGSTRPAIDLYGKAQDKLASIHLGSTVRRFKGNAGETEWNQLSLWWREAMLESLVSTVKDVQVILTSQHMAGRGGEPEPDT